MMNRLSPSRLLTLALAVLVLGVLPGCVEDAELLEPEGAGEGALFDRYVSIGNSITAGFQAAGINASTQLDAYPVLLAGQMGTNFDVPLVRNPGCPPPLAQIFPTPMTIAPSVDCALRDPDVPETLNNLAVPGAAVVDVVDNLNPASSPNALTTFLLGGRTQLEAAQEVAPTFASIWIGNNDVLGSALAGTSAGITSQSDFESRYTQILDGLALEGESEGALLVSVANPVLAPNLSPGVAYLQAIPQAQAAGLAPPNLQVANTCAPAAMGGVGETTFVPFQYGATLLQVASAVFNPDAPEQSPVITIDCAQDRTVREAVSAALGGVPPAIDERIAGTANISLLTSAELQAVATAVAGYNQFIAAQADARGYAFLDINPILAAEQRTPDNPGGRIPLFPNLTSAQVFGPLFSLDGVHPSSLAHRIIADAAIEAINAEYGTRLQPLD